MFDIRKKMLEKLNGVPREIYDHMKREAADKMYYKARTEYLEGVLNRIEIECYRAGKEGVPARAFEASIIQAIIIGVPDEKILHDLEEVKAFFTREEDS